MGSLKRLFLRFITQPFRFCKIEDKVVFANFKGRGMGDDPKYIALELLRRNCKAKLIWLAKDVKQPFPEGITPVKYNSIASYYHLYTAKVWINNIKHSSIWMNKRPGQYYIQTWHSTFGFKKCEQDIPLASGYVRDAKHDASITDLMYTDNDFEYELYSHHFWYNGPVLKCDVPRVSVLLNPPVDLREKVCRELGIPPYKKIILHGPTFRKDKGLCMDVFNLDYEQIIHAAEAKFGGEFVVVLRLHPNAAKMAKKIRYTDNVFMGTSYPDMQELMAVADLAISDYSGWIFDYILTRRPALLFMPDLRQYQSSDRGLYRDITEIPLPQALTEAEILQCISEFDNQSYNEALNGFFAEFGFEEHGQGDKVLADIVESKLC